jgi:hypothetical protein
MVSFVMHLDRKMSDGLIDIGDLSVFSPQCTVSYTGIDYSVDQSYIFYDSFVNKFSDNI